MVKSEIKQSGWIRAVDEELVSINLDIASEDDSYEEAKRKLEIIIRHNMNIALNLYRNRCGKHD